MEIKSILINGKKFTATSDDQYLTAMGQDFEPHMVELFRSIIGPNDIIADIGANIGLTALLFSNLVKFTYAFEPSPSTFNILRKNLEINKIKNVEIINLGLGQKFENLNITFARNNRSGGFVSEKIQLQGGYTTERIQIDTLDNFFKNKNIIPTFLKIDVEGFEQSVISGGVNFLEKYQPTVVMEMNHFCLGVLQRITIPDFLDFMRTVFPVLYAIDTDNKTIADLHDPDKAYFVMHEHVVHQRFPNLVCGFSKDLIKKLEALARPSINSPTITSSLQSAVNKVMNKLVQGRIFETPTIPSISGIMISKINTVELSADIITKFSVSIKNQGESVWCGYGLKPVLLSYHWLNSDGTVHLYDGLRTPLNCELIEPGKQSEEVVNVQMPTISGKYTLVLTLLQEGICWFEDKGFTPALIEVNIT